MNGQWHGNFDGTYQGNLVLNLDDRGPIYEGTAYFAPLSPGLPIVTAGVRTADKATTFTLRTSSLQPMDPQTGEISLWDVVKKKYGDFVTFPSYADVSGAQEGETLNVAITTEKGSHFNAKLVRSNASAPSTLQSRRMEWSEFKTEVSTFAPRKFLFRGQKRPHRLRTAFHRSGRADLRRFKFEDIPALYRHLSGRTKHLFDMNRPDETGAFYNLAQHHGYPTPLLDWTLSPYVAAFFAFRNVTNEQAAKASADDHARVFVFDQESWKASFLQTLMVEVPYRHVSIGEFLAIENERLIPQQGVSTLTNVDDIESYVQEMEVASKNTYLFALDIPIKQRKIVIQELHFMGITAGSLFPGLDGACEELKERFFDI